MKVAAITLRGFKRFDELHVDVCNQLTGDVAEQFLILGDNGTGKTTLLQAVALCLSLACWRTRRVDEFEWLGWVPGRFQQWGVPFVEIEVRFSAGELRATREAARRWWHSNGTRNERFIEPADAAVVRLRLEGERYSAGSQEELHQFHGRWYAQQLLKTDASARQLFEDLPGVFWFDQFRNLATPLVPQPDDERAAGTTYATGVARLRQYLNRWVLDRAMKKRPPQPDFLSELEAFYQRVFPGRSFAGPEPMYGVDAPTPVDYYFTLSDGHRTYDIEEMSAGEQSVFPLLYEFVRQRIRNSVVLIDEIDLNLHPPLAQSLLAALPAIGPNCQYLLTTHSEAVSAVVSPEQVQRLEGGRLCL